MDGLLKKKVSIVRGYKPFWFVLSQDGYLAYYEEKPAKPGEKPKGKMLLLLSDTITNKDGVSFRVVSASNRVFKLRAQDRAKREKWLAEINNIRTKMYNKMFKGFYDNPDIERKRITEDEIFDDQFETLSQTTDEEVEYTDPGSPCSDTNIASLFQERKKPFVAVAAIDFGTTYSGCAFSTTAAFKIDPLKIETIPLDDKHVFSYKTPTVLLLTPEGKFHSFGATAEEKYVSLAENEEANDWYYFNKFKMQLYKNKQLSSDMVLREMSGKTMKATLVFAFCIEFIKDKVVERLLKAIPNLLDDDIHWVLTVPAIWNDQARQFMIKAAETAGIEKQNLSLALEPESAAMCCKYLELDKKEKGEATELKSFAENARFMVVDLGGGTIDITVSEVLSTGQLKEIYNATGGPWGGNYINTEIVKTLREIIGWEKMRKLQAKDLEAYLELIREVEERKRSVRQNEEFALRIPELIQQQLNIPDGYKDKVQIRKRKLCLSSELMQKLFSSSVDKMVSHVKNLLSKDEMKGVSTILLVGGYAASETVQKSFKEVFGSKYQIIFPLTPDMIVLKGAVISGHMTEAIVGRVAKYHYGLAFRRKAQFGRTVSLDENEIQTFFPLIKKGQKIKVGDVVTEYEIILQAKSTYADVDVYITEDDEPMEEIDDDHFTKVGSIHVKLPRFKNQSILILTISYDETEFKVVATDKNTGRCFIGVCKFLDHELPSPDCKR